MITKTPRKNNSFQKDLTKNYFEGELVDICGSPHSLSPSSQISFKIITSSLLDKSHTHLPRNVKMEAGESSLEISRVGAFPAQHPAQSLCWEKAFWLPVPGKSFFRPFPARFSILPASSLSPTDAARKSLFALNRPNPVPLSYNCRSGSLLLAFLVSLPHHKLPDLREP